VEEDGEEAVGCMAVWDVAPCGRGDDRSPMHERQRRVRKWVARAGRGCGVGRVRGQKQVRGFVVMVAYDLLSWRGGGGSQRLWARCGRQWWSAADAVSSAGCGGG
jgi:hypothetical protein